MKQTCVQNKELDVRPTAHFKRNSYSNGREELGRKILRFPGVMNFKNSEHTEVG